MEQFSLSNIKALIADSTDLSITTIRNLLSNRGMHDFVIVRDADSLEEHLKTHSYDLLVTNVYLNDQDITPFLQSIRQGDLGDNPFVPIIALAWEPSVLAVGSMLSGGVDVILTIPMSADKMDRALDHLVMRRKPFVITADYIGPDRRKEARPGESQAPMMVVPNAVKRKALGYDGADVGDPTEVFKVICDRRVESYISRITYTIAKISGLTGDGQSQIHGTMEDWLEELKVISTNLSYRIAETSYAHQSALCHTLIDIAAQIEQHGTPDAAEMELLQQIALALEIAVKRDDEDTVNAALNIEKLVEQTIDMPARSALLNAKKQTTK